MIDSISPITPERVAEKFAAAQNFQAQAFRSALAADPRLRELIWFIQWQSCQPGGLPHFVDGFLTAISDRIGTSVMRGIPGPVYSAKERKAVIESFPHFDHEICPTLLHRTYGKPQRPEETAVAAWTHDFNITMRGFDPADCYEKTNTDAAFVASRNRAEFQALCRSLAAAHLPLIFRDFCEIPETLLPDLFYLSDMAGCLFDYMEAHAARERGELADTEIVLKTFDGLEYAFQEKSLVKIEGDSRFGKTESIKAWSRMFPGRCRLVTTPCSNSERDLFANIAEALGVSFTFKTSARELKTKIEFILRHGRIMFIFDEGHWIFPVRFNATTTPSRLNWIRSELVDKGCPVAIVTTPQCFQDAAAKFVKSTGYNLAQFIGRVVRTIRLPDELEPADLIAVARKHFPELRESHLKLIAGAALKSENYLHAVQAIAKLARYLARRDNHPSITLADIEQSIAEFSGVTTPSTSVDRSINPSPTANRNGKPTETAPVRSVRPATALEASLDTSPGPRSGRPATSALAPALESPARETGASLTLQSL